MRRLLVSWSCAVLLTALFPLTAGTTVAGAPASLEVPCGQAALVSPADGPPGTDFRMQISGFRPNEKVSYWLTAPDQSVLGGFDAETVDDQGQATFTFGGARTATLSPGIWAFTFQGLASGHQAIVYFGIAEEPSVTAAVVSVAPEAGTPHTQFTVEARGFTCGEKVGVWFTDPHGKVWYPRFQLDANDRGALAFTFVPSELFAEIGPGRWAFTAEGAFSHLQGIAHFEVGAGEGESPAPPPSAAASVLVTPEIGADVTEFIVEGHGFLPGENIGIWFTDPRGVVWYADGWQETADEQGSFVRSIVPATDFNEAPLGRWAFTAQGVTSGRQGVAYFELSQ